MAKPPDQTNIQTIEHLIKKQISNAKSINAPWTGLFVLCVSAKSTAAPFIPKMDKMAKPSDQTNKQTIEHLITSQICNAKWTLFLQKH